MKWIESEHIKKTIYLGLKIIVLFVLLELILSNLRNRQFSYERAFINIGCSYFFFFILPIITKLFNRNK